MEQKCYSLTNLSRFPNNSFIREYKSEFNQKIYTFELITNEISKCLDHFKRIGINNHVGIGIDIREHSAESCTLLLGILNHGCYFYCTDFDATSAIQTHLKVSAVEYVISKDVKNMERICSKVYEGFQILSQNYYIGKVNVSADKQYLRNLNICYTIATSGSTGLPKMVHVPYECIEPNIKSLCSRLQINESDVIFLGSPPTFDPFVVELFMAVEKGATLLITSHLIRLTPSAKLLQTVTILQTTPSLFRLFGIQIIRDVVFHPRSALRCLLLGGESFPSHQEIQSWLPENYQCGSTRIFNVYGITEVSCWATIYEYLPSNEYTRGRVSLGKPLDKLTLLRIIDESDGNDLPSTGCCKGELLIGSSVRRCLIPEYEEDINAWNNKDTIFRKSGDIVERDVNGNLFYIGRINNFIKRLGKRVCLDALAVKIEYFLKRKAVCLWQENHNKLIICLIWNKNEMHNKPNIQRLLKENLSDFEQPDHVCYINDPPLNKHGKVDRKELLNAVLNKRKLLRKTPLNIFENFLDDILCLYDYTLLRQQNESAEGMTKRMKRSFDICFTAAGGTSFQALSIATEIGELLEQPEDQRKLLEMLLSPESSLQQIIEYLTKITHAVQIGSKRALLDHRIEICNKAFSIKLLWRSNLKKCVDATPTLYQETRVTVGSHSRLILTLDTTTGEEISRTELADRVECPVVFVSPHLAVVGCYDGMLYGFNFNSGSILWKIKANGMIKAKPLVIGNLVIVGSYAEDFNIRAFDLETLRCVWYLNVGSKGIFASPLKVTDYLALLCSLDGSYALIEISSGSIKWLRKLESPIFSTPAQLKTSKNELILAEVKGRVTICNQDNGEELTYFQADGNIFSGITLYQKTSQKNLILFGCHDGHVYCLNYESLTTRISLVWKLSLNAAVYSTPIITPFDDAVLACSTKGLIVLIDIATAQLKGRYNVNGEIFSTPCCTRKKYIYVGSRDNFLYALEVQ